MKAIQVVLFLIYFSEVYAQSKSSSVSLVKGIKLTAVIKKFNTANHKIDTCRDEFLNRYICRIDGKRWYGSDKGLELPRSQLVRLTISIHNKPIALNVAGMFNPVYSFQLNPQHFKIEKKGHDYFLFGFFSDGAGTYTAHWKILGGKSTRLKISNNEKDFTWQKN